jgi:hypothetical protein
MEFTSQPQADVQQSPMIMENHSLQNIFSFNNNGFSESMYTNPNFMTSAPQMPTYSEKALPPIPQENDVTMLQTQNANEPQAAQFDQWSMLTGSTFDDGTHLVIPTTFDPRNQF